MKAVIGAIFLLCLGVSAAEAATECIPKRDCKGNIARSSQQVKAFRTTHPCPLTGKKTGACPGYVVDHIIALCVCGKDRPSNMQWQTVAEAKVKDRYECKIGGRT